MAAWFMEEIFVIFHFEQRTTEGVGLNDLVQGKVTPGPSFAGRCGAVAAPRTVDLPFLGEV